MKVVLKQTVYDRIVADLRKAQAERREVDYIAVTKAEYDELHEDFRGYAALASDMDRCFAPSDKVSDACFKVGTFEFTGTDRDLRYPGRYLQVPSFATFMGKTLYVVPPGYMPR